MFLKKKGGRFGLWSPIFRILSEFLILGKSVKIWVHSLGIVGLKVLKSGLFSGMVFERGEFDWRDATCVGGQREADWPRSPSRNVGGQSAFAFIHSRFSASCQTTPKKHNRNFSDFLGCWFFGARLSENRNGRNSSLFRKRARPSSLRRKGKNNRTARQTNRSRG